MGIANNNIIDGYFLNNSDGAIYFQLKSTNNTINATFINHTPKHVGVIHFEDISINNIIDSKFINNKILEHGAAITYYAGAINNIIKGEFINNTAEYNGGAIAIYQAQGYIEPVYNLTISGIFINNTAKQKGGAIYINYAYNVLFDNCTFDNNYGLQGGAIFIDKNVNATIINSRFTNNNNDAKLSKNVLGGAIFLNTSNINIDSCDFDNNQAYYGGGIFFEDIGTVINSKFINNKRAFGGSGIYFKNDGIVINCNFTNHTSEFDGAAIYFQSNATIIGSIFTENCVSSYGGAVYVKGLANITNSQFILNNATCGGAIYLENLGYIVSCIFNSNSAKNNAGGAILSNNIITINNSTFTNNTAIKKGGAIITYGGGIIRNSIFIDNSAHSGGAISTTNMLNISQNIFQGNIAIDGTNDFNLENNSILKYIVDLNLIEIKDIKYGDNVKINISVFCEGKPLNEGKVTVNIKGLEYSAKVYNGKAVILIPKLNVGNYTVNVNFNGGINYTQAFLPVTFSVLKQNAKILATSKTFVINYGGKYSITLKDVNNKQISGLKISFKFNGKNLYATTNSKGIATIKFSSDILKKAKAGKHNLVITLNNKNYNTITKTVKININKEKTKLIAQNTKFKKYLKIKKYGVILKNSKGKAIKNAKLALKINGKTYQVKTNSKGIACFKITNLRVKGKFIAKILFKTTPYYQSISKTVKITVQ